MIDPRADLTTDVIHGLGWLWLILFAMNAAWSARSFRQGERVQLGRGPSGRAAPAGAIWAVYSALLLGAAIAHFAWSGRPSGFPIGLPGLFKDLVNAVVASPVIYFVGLTAAFAVLIARRRWFVKPTVAWCVLNVALVFIALSMTDWDFRQIVGKPDNVPIVAMLFLMGYFVWLSFRRACDNDRRRTEGRPLREEDNNTKVLVWPDLVYIELICMVALTAVLIFWGLGLQAPLEQPASAVETPNPSKAPWYFLGLQEILVYFDPWLAGVVFPVLIIFGLMAIPYLDVNPKGNGYYTFAERKFAIVTFLFGFVLLWIATIVIGTFLRGPNWNLFGIYERWDAHKLQMLTSVNLSEYFYLYGPEWLPWAGALPAAPPGASGWTNFVTILLREAPGILLILVYFLVLPPLLGHTLFRSFVRPMGRIRYLVFVNLLLLMAALPIKMILCWSFNLKYIVAIPEWFFNI